MVGGLRVEQVRGAGGEREGAQVWGLQEQEPLHTCRAQGPPGHMLPSCFLSGPVSQGITLFSHFLTPLCLFCLCPVLPPTFLSVTFVKHRSQLRKEEK